MCCCTTLTARVRAVWRGGVQLPVNIGGTQDGHARIAWPQQPPPLFYFLAAALPHCTSCCVVQAVNRPAPPAAPPGRIAAPPTHPHTPSAGLRAPEEQLWLGRLAQCPAVHLLASVDHVGAAALWDKGTAALFRWCWQHAATYAPYELETLDLPPLLTGSWVGEE